MKDKRLKASDVFHQTEYLFTDKVPFRKAFPKIKSLKVIVKESGRDIHKYNSKRYYTEENAGQYINCSNSACFNGGFNLGSILRMMDANYQKEVKETFYCQGYEGSPKGRKKYCDCDNIFEVECFITYKKDK